MTIYNKDEDVILADLCSGCKVAAKSGYFCNECNEEWREEIRAGSKGREKTLLPNLW